eukprot:TRINITY_DN17721_c0_g2_i3.p1 TRINITY_DN17721_c0_g2~~TRINITY_DN17721_c0_g2_i3.p1  ORF type:complete len:960 (+),score=136.87 TRINITY_DN17721_c0_g2_i3:108-2987(+)
MAMLGHVLAPQRQVLHGLPSAPARASVPLTWSGAPAVSRSATGDTSAAVMGPRTNSRPATAAPSVGVYQVATVTCSGDVASTAAPLVVRRRSGPEIPAPAAASRPQAVALASSAAAPAANGAPLVIRRRSGGELPASAGVRVQDVSASATVMCGARGSGGVVLLQRPASASRIVVPHVRLGSAGQSAAASSPSAASSTTASVAVAPRLPGVGAVCAASASSASSAETSGDLGGTQQPCAAEATELLCSVGSARDISHQQGQQVAEDLGMTRAAGSSMKIAIEPAEDEMLYAGSPCSPCSGGGGGSGSARAGGGFASASSPSELGAGTGSTSGGRAECISQYELNRVYFAFSASEEDASQLSLVVGDLVRVQCRDPSGWTYGHLDCHGEVEAALQAERHKLSGWFPDAVLRGQPAESLDADRKQLEQASLSSVPLDEADEENFDKVQRPREKSTRPHVPELLGRLGRNYVGPEDSRTLSTVGAEETLIGLTSKGTGLHQSERRLAELARSRQRYLDDKESADRGTVDAELDVESAERVFSSMEEQARRCRAEAVGVAGSSSGSLRRNWETKLRLLEAKREVAASNLQHSRDRLAEERAAASAARRKLQDDQHQTLNAMEAVSRQRSIEKNAQGDSDFGGRTRATTPARSQSASRTSPQRSRNEGAPQLATSARASDRARNRKASSPVPINRSNGSTRLQRGSSPLQRTTPASHADVPEPKTGLATNFRGAAPPPSAPSSAAAATLNGPAFAFSPTWRSSSRNPSPASRSQSASRRGPPSRENIGRSNASPGRCRAGSPVSSAGAGRTTVPPAQGCAERTARSSRSRTPSQGRASTASAFRAEERATGPELLMGLATPSHPAAPLPSPDIAGGDRADLATSLSDGMTDELACSAEEVLRGAEELQAKLAAFPEPMLSRLAQTSAGLRGFIEEARLCRGSGGGYAFPIAGDAHASVDDGLSI